MKIDFGCGLNKKEGYIGVDSRAGPGIDFVCDIEREKLPFESNSIDEIYTHHSLEHIHNIIGAMNEFFRVLKWGGKFNVVVPDFRCIGAFQDPTHVRFWTEESMKYFCGEYLKKYQLDYEIACCFHLDKITSVVPEGKKPEYMTELHFALEKNKEWINEVGYSLLNDRIFSEKKFDSVQMFIKKTKQMQDIFLKKNVIYGNAFFDSKKHGDDKVFLHLERNWIKIQEQWNQKHNFILSDESENFFIDMANYCIMTLIRSEMNGN